MVVKRLLVSLISGLFSALSLWGWSSLCFSVEPPASVMGFNRIHSKPYAEHRYGKEYLYQNRLGTGFSVFVFPAPPESAKHPEGASGAAADAFIDAASLLVKNKLYQKAAVAEREQVSVTGANGERFSGHLLMLEVVLEGRQFNSYVLPVVVGKQIMKLRWTAPFGQTAKNELLSTAKALLKQVSLPQKASSDTPKPAVSTLPPLDDPDGM